MRIAFINTLIELAEKDKQIFLLTGDLGFSLLERFQEKFPDRYFDVGVAEANMIGVAAGLALSGKTVFVYSIAPFATMRCFEQIRNDLCYQNLNVKIIGVGGGLHYGSAGPTHHSIVDISIMRSLPNMTVICPGDPIEAELATRFSASYKTPIYIRLGKSNEPKVHLNTPDFAIGKGITIKKGDDVTLIATGNLLYNAKCVSENLTNNGIDVRLISMHTIKPLDKKIILKAANETKAIFTLEEHSIVGGLGSAVAEVLAEEDVKEIFFKRISLPDAFCLDIGDHEYLRKKNSLSVEQIANTILKCYKTLKG